MELDVEAGGAGAVELRLGGTSVVYTPRDDGLTVLGNSAALAGARGRLRLRALLDRTPLEIFAAGGRCVMSFCVRPGPGSGQLAITETGGEARIASLLVRELRSIWWRGFFWAEGSRGSDRLTRAA